MRVSSGLMMGRYVKQINKSYENQAKLMEQSDGSNLHRPSDDSVKYSKYLRYQNSNTENLQYQDNVKAGISWMKTADAAAVNMTDIYTTLKEKTIDAANDTNGELDLKAIAKEFKAKLYEIVSLGNTQQGDRYVFSGQSDLTQPFVVSVEEKDRGLAKTLDDPQAAFFTNPTDTSLNVSDAGSLKQMLTLEGSDGNTYYVNPMNGYVYTEDFIMEGYKDKVATGQSHVADGDEVAKLQYFASSSVKVSSYFMNTGEEKQSSSVTITNPSTGTTTGTYNVGDPLPLAANETAVSTMDVEITDANGNTRIVSAGNTIGPLATGETASIGASLRATMSGTTNATVIDNSTTPPTTTTTQYQSGDTLSMNVGDTAIVGMDIQVTDASGNVSIISAGNAYTMAAGDTAVITGAQMNPSSTGVTVIDTTTSPATTTTTRYSPGSSLSGLSVGDTIVAGMDIDVTDASGNVTTIAAGDTYTWQAGDSAVVSSVSSTAGANGIPARNTTFKMAVVSQPIVSYEGDARYISMVKLNGSVDQTADTVNLTGQDLNGSDIFDDANSGNQTTLMSNGTLCYVSSGTALLNSMFTVCAKMEDGNNRWMSTDGITIADMSHSTVVTAQSSTAARQNVYDSVDSMLDKQNEAITSDLNDVSATDVAELAVKLMAAQTIYNMSLSVGSRILPPSLADYL